jgi:hypothetical protein
MRFGAVMYAPALLALAVPAQAAAAGVEAPPAWITDASGARYRVRFDPGERIILSVGADTRADRTAGFDTPGLALEVGVFHRSDRPAPGWDVHWKKNHEFARVRIRPAADSRGVLLDGALYRGLYLRQQREGTLTLPLNPPVAIALPFDVGLRFELGRFRGGGLWPEPGGPPINAGVVDAEVLTDFWRSRLPGRWLAIGIGGRYEVGLSRDATGDVQADHRVSPMSTLSVAMHAERADGLAAGGLRGEASHRWSGARGWERTFRVDGDIEVTPLAVNDRPISLFAMATAATGGELSLPELRVLAGVRFAAPTR